MADNTTLNTGSGGDVIATDDIAGVKFQRVKLILGADGSNDGDVSSANPVPVTGTITAVTSLTNALPAGTNAIGKLAANSGVDIGDVDVTTMPGTAAEGAALPAAFVVVAADDGTDTQPLQLSAGGDLKITLDSETVALAAGTNNIGDVDILSIAAGDNNIGNVDIVTMPGTAAEGAALPAVFVVVAGDDGTDTQPLQLSAGGDLKVTLDSETVTVDLGVNNDVTVTSGNITADTELPNAAALADTTSNPTVPAVGSFLMVWNGTSWDRAQSSIGALTTGTLRVNLATDIPTPHGWRATAHGANPTADAAGTQGLARTNRHGVQFVIGGHPNPITRSVRIADADGAQTNASIVGTIAAGTKVAVTAFSVACSRANTVNVAVKLGFGAASIPGDSTTGADGVLFDHEGIAPGSGVAMGNGGGILGIGADGEELRLTCDDPVTGHVTVTFTYFTIES